MARYAIWNKRDRIITPIGEVLTPQQWMDRYPVAALDEITVVCGGGEINGSFFGTLGQMVDLYQAQGCDFSGAESDQEKLEAIEAFEDARNAQDPTPSVQERTAAALEFIALSSLPDQTV